ncbi:uncharacterized protein TNCV_1590211 [Trichonephila clavipes]|uniref:Uncharacterized protein n=1 Tax=Trichonephila clavipes TaxID=2585209 RepID=A0A8X6RFS8_TRICX|nr:uncharacterized protein TNCV_1590211 [Trichonephila clavipes]
MKTMGKFIPGWRKSAASVVWKTGAPKVISNFILLLGSGLAACVREYTLEFFTLLNTNGKKGLIEWGMKKGLIALSYECPKCNDQHDATWSAIKRFLRNRTSHAECMFDHYLAE